MVFNKNGWGLREMLIWSGVLVLFLFIAIFYIYTLYQNLDTELSVKTYYDLEEKLEAQASVYLQDYYDGVLDENDITISRSTLRAYDLDVSLVDSEGRVCSGYVVANKSDVKAYISCREYTTDGYESWRS